MVDQKRSLPGRLHYKQDYRCGQSRLNGWGAGCSCLKLFWCLKLGHSRRYLSVSFDGHKLSKVLIGQLCRWIAWIHGWQEMIAAEPVKLLGWREVSVENLLLQPYSPSTKKKIKISYMNGASRAGLHWKGWGVGSPMPQTGWKIYKEINNIFFMKTHNKVITIPQTPEISLCVELDITLKIKKICTHACFHTRRNIHVWPSVKTTMYFRQILSAAKLT